MTASENTLATDDSWFLMMARYNRWMNEKLFAIAAGLDEQALRCDRGAYFGSILGTLNHVMTGDVLWLKRFAGHEALAQPLALLQEVRAPSRLNDELFDDLPSLWQYRRRLDAALIEVAEIVGGLPPDTVLSYCSMKGMPARRSLQALAIHLFNHQTHHRGQATTLLKQAGIDPGETDLLMLIPEL